MYCKLFASLYQGTLRGRANEILVFTNLLAHCDKDGYVDKHFRAIAEEIGITVEAVKSAVEHLEAPDPESRSPELGGARLERMDAHRAWGWRVVNFLKYREIRDLEDRRNQNRNAQIAYRKKNADCHEIDDSKQSKPPSASVSQRKPASAEVSQGKPQSAYTDTDTDTDTDTEKYKKVAHARAAIHHLNEKTGKRFREVESSMVVISARLSEPGVTIEGVLKMIDRQVDKWKGTTMEEYLRPETLFGKQKFDGYYAAKDQPIQNSAVAVKLPEQNQMQEKIKIKIL
jgi:uncharacterized phage protein (TIGR02220 family)